MTALSFWFVRHKPTGYVIHQGAGPNKSLGSYVEPEPATNRIKLFTREHYARAWLTRWLRGREERVYLRGDKEKVVCKPVATRKADEMEIVQLKVRLP
jgi:hypothetical protein